MNKIELHCGICLLFKFKRGEIMECDVIIYEVRCVALPFIQHLIANNSYFVFVFLSLVYDVCILYDVNLFCFIVSCMGVEARGCVLYALYYIILIYMLYSTHDTNIVLSCIYMWGRG